MKAGRAQRRVATEFVRRVGRASEDDLEKVDGVRGRVLVAGVFRLMPLQVDRRAASRVSGTIEFRITEADGGATLHTLILREGRLRVRRGVVAEPDLVVELAAGDFLRLAAGVESGPALFAEGRLRLRGDLGLALRLPRVFRVPRAGARTRGERPGGPAGDPEIDSAAERLR